MASLEMQSFQIDVLQLELFCPTGLLGDHTEVLPEIPLQCYLFEFLVSTEVDEGLRSRRARNNEFDRAAEPAGLDDDDASEMSAASSCAAKSDASFKRMNATEQRWGLEFADG